MTPPISIALRPSRRLLQLLAVAHLLGVIAILTLTVSPWLSIGLLLLIVVSGLFQFRRVRDLPIAALRLLPRGSCEITTKVGARETAELLHGTILLPGLIVLALRVAGQRHTLVLLPDSAASDDLRRLRVWLRCRAGEVSASV